MGCTSSKENTNPPSSTTISDRNQQVIDDQFRNWLKSNRPQADEYVLNDVIATEQSASDIDEYRLLVKKALDLLSERHDIKTTNKFKKLLQKEVPSASEKNVSYTVQILEQTAEKLRQDKIMLKNGQQKLTTVNGEVANKSTISDNEHGQISSSDVGIALKEALETARISFYKGKQAAIFANPNGGYDVRIIDQNDDALNQDGNLLRSIIVTEVKMRPKPSTISPKFSTPSPPPPTTKLLDEHEIGDDFRRSIDAALKGLEAIYHTSPSETQDTHTTTTNQMSQTSTSKDKPTTNQPEQRAISQIDIDPKLVGAVDQMNELLLDTIETITRSEIGNPMPPKNYNVVEKLVRIVPNEDSKRITQEGREELSTSNKINDDNESTTNIRPSSPKMPTSISQVIEEHNKKPLNAPFPPVVGSIDTNATVKSPSHHVTYTEIIHSESRDGEQSRRFTTESYDEQPSIDDDAQKTSLKVVTKSEFSTDPSSNEKTMEQSVQVIKVKVRNETVKTTIPLSTSPNDKQPSRNDVNTIDTTI